MTIMLPHSVKPLGSWVLVELLDLFRVLVTKTVFAFSILVRLLPVHLGCALFQMQLREEDSDQWEPFCWLVQTDYGDANDDVSLTYPLCSLIYLRAYSTSPMQWKSFGQNPSNFLICNSGVFQSVILLSFLSSAFVSDRWRSETGSVIN